MIVASDLEGTITAGATWKGIGRYFQTHGRATAYRFFFWSRFSLAPLVKLGLLDEQAFRNRWIADLPQLLRNWALADIQDLAEWVVEHELWPKRRVAIVSELEQHQREGRRVVLASATYQPVLDVFARRINAVALGTPLEIIAGQATGRLGGEINAGARKAAQLGAFLQNNTLHTAYGDTLPDVPMLKLSTNPVVVHPDAQLLNIAQAKGWRIVRPL